MKTFKCVFLSSTQSGPNPFWKGAYRGARGNYGHRCLNLCIFASSSATLKLTWWKMRIRHPLMAWINIENVIQSLFLSYL